MITGRSHFGASGLKVFTALISTLLFAALFAGCSAEAPGTSSSGPPKRPPVPVTVGTAVEKDVPVQLALIGNVKACSRVAIKAQIQGELTKVYFKEGQEVKQGDPLFTIDPRPYEAKVKLAEANLARDKAQLINAQKKAERYRSVVEKGYVAEEQFETITANAAALEATVHADEAAVESAKLDLRYCQIPSPIDGITGGLRVNRGNVIKATDNDNPLVIINQIRPIYVTFAVPERSLPQIMQYMGKTKLDVLASIPGAEADPVRGEFSFLENEINANAGTILVTASFPNVERRLWPGQFVNVVMNLTTQKNQVVIPSQAVQMGQAGAYVYVVKPDSSVEYRLVATGARIDGEVVIEKGVAAGETVVTDGQIKLAAGASIKIVQAPGSAGGEGAPK